LSYSREYFEAFGIALCDSCKRDEKLINKSLAKQKYLVTDGDLSRLGSLSKENPRHREWSKMKLYLESQVSEVSRLKHGDEEDLEHTRDERIRKRILKRQERRVETKLKNERKGKRLKVVKEKVERDYGEAHVHTFRAPTSPDGNWVCSVCGFVQQEVEEF